MSRRWHPPRIPSPHEQRAEHHAAAAIERAGIHDEIVAGEDYPELAYRYAVSSVATALLRQRRDLLPRERTAPITAAELRDRMRVRAAREAPAAEEDHDAIPF